MELNFKRGGQLYRQAFASGMKRPFAPSEKAGVVSDNGGGEASMDMSEEQLLVLLPGETNLSQISAELELAKPLTDGSAALLISFSKDSTDGRNGEWSMLGSVGQRTPSRIAGTLTLVDCAAAWLRLWVVDTDQGGPIYGRGLWRFFSVCGDPDRYPLEFRSQGGKPLDSLDMGFVCEGGSRRRPFWVKNIGRHRVELELFLEPEDPKMEGRFWLNDGSRRTRRLEVDSLDPEVVAGPFWVEVTPTQRDERDAHRGHVFVAVKECVWDDD